MLIRGARQVGESTLVRMLGAAFEHFIELNAEKANANAEVDLVYAHRGLLLPIAIKAGAQGRLRSLHQFVERSGHAVALRFLNNTFSHETARTPNGHDYQLINLPYYLMSQVEQYAAWAIEKFANK